MEQKVQELLNRQYFEQRSDEWLALRENMLTASDVASALGHNRYEKPDDLLAKKVMKKAWAGNAATAHGTLLEPVARDLYDARTNRKTHEIGLVQHPKYPFLGGSADGITEDGILVEIKCPLTRKIEDKVPEHYLPQIQLLLEILDFEDCDFVQYRPASVKYLKTKGPCEESGNVPRPVEEPVPEIFMVTRITRDRSWFEQHLKTMQVFWGRVESARKNGLCEVVWDEPGCGQIDCEVIEDDTPQDCSGPWVEVPAQAQVSHMQGVPGQFLCEVHSA
jgi:putative phage-type endonuclease